MAFVEIRDLHKTYGKKEVLTGLDLSIDKGEFYAIIGPTGSGKTTLLRLIDLLESPTSGRISFNNINTSDNRMHFKLRRRMAFVSQKPAVFQGSVFHNIACGLKWRGEKNIEQQVDELLKLVELFVEPHVEARNLSGGEIQRVAIARALAVKPDLFLLDEPTANLDLVSISKIEKVLSDVNQAGVTIIMATHDLSQGQRLADRMSVLINGAIVQTGSQNEVFYSPWSTSIAQFIGNDNIYGGVVVKNEDGIALINVNDKIIEATTHFSVGEKVYIAIHPENVALSLTNLQSSARNSFIGDINQINYSGALARVEIDCGFMLRVLLTRRSAEELDLSLDKKVYVSFKATAVHVMKE